MYQLTFLLSHYCKGADTRIMNGCFYLVL